MLLRYAVILSPIGVLCGLAGLVLVMVHLNGPVVLVSGATLPLNAYLCLIQFGVIRIAC